MIYVFFFLKNYYPSYMGECTSSSPIRVDFSTSVFCSGNLFQFQMSMSFFFFRAFKILSAEIKILFVGPHKCDYRERSKGCIWRRLHRSP